MQRTLLSVAKVTAILIQICLSVHAYAQNDYPMGPREEMTPGTLCDTPDSYRYPEQIPYCRRDVHSDLKREIIRLYDERFGYRIQSMDRGQFKIDHYIPLCAGGSNDIENLWPQHSTVFRQTDSLEQLVCEKMAQGRLSQSGAVTFIREAKNDLSKVRDILRRVRSL